MARHLHAGTRLGATHRFRGFACAAAAFVGALLAPTGAQALPAFARQTGQSCVACHAGGQFPELTPYGRLFKLTGYTWGEHTIPLSVMASTGFTKTRNTTGEDAADFPKDGTNVFQGGSLFLAGKVTDYVGLFAQYTYDNYDHQNDQGRWIGHSSSDNTDIRAAYRIINPDLDLIFGLTVNNNPTVQDVWNSTPAFAFPYLTSQFQVSPTVGGTLIEGGLAQQAAGPGIYAYWNQTLYAELAGYRTAEGVLSFMSQGISFQDTTKLNGLNPYWRLNLTHAWGAHNASIGTYGLIADVYPDPTNPTGPTNKYRDIAVDAQYQYLLDPHTVTAQFNYVKEKITWNSDAVTNGEVGNADAYVYSMRLKGSYFYRNRYGGSLQYFNIRGTTDPVLYGTQTTDPDTGLPVGSTAVTGNFTGSPSTRGLVAELNWMPVQYLRVGLQYWMYNSFNGASVNYDGLGRDAKANDTLFLYVWGAY